MPKRRTKSKHVEGVKAKSEDSKGKSRNVRVTKAKSKAKGEDKNKDHKDVDDEVELDCRFCDFTSESEKILRKHIRSAHSADTSDEALNDTTSASFAVSAFSLNRLRDPACSSTTFLPSKHMELLLRMARLGRTHSVIKLLLMYIEHPHIIGHRKLSVDSLIVMVDSLLMQACALDEETKSRLKSAIESICERGPSEKIKWNDGVYPRSFP